MLDFSLSSFFLYHLHHQHPFFSRHSLYITKMEDYESVLLVIRECFGNKPISFTCLLLIQVFMVLSLLQYIGYHQEQLLGDTGIYNEMKGCHGGNGGMLAT